MSLNHTLYKKLIFIIYALYMLAWIVATSTALGVYSLSIFFDITIYKVQFWNGIMTLLFSCSQIFVGPISDTIGRKKTVLITLLITIIGLLLCVISRHFTMFCIGLLLIGIGAGPLAILSRAIAKDVYKKDKLFYVYSIISFMTVAAWFNSSIVNTIAQFLEIWQVTYCFLLSYSLVLLFIVKYFFVETLPRTNRKSLSVSSFCHAYLTVLTNRSYIKYNYIWSILYSCLVGGIYVYLPVLFFKSSAFEKQFFMSLIMTFYAFGIIMLRSTISKLQPKFISKYTIALASLTIPYFILVLILNLSAVFYIPGFCIFSFCTGSVSSMFITEAMSCVKEKSIDGYAAAIIGVSGSLFSSLVSTTLSLSGEYQGLVLVVVIIAAILSSAYFIARL